VRTHGTASFSQGSFLLFLLLFTPVTRVCLAQQSFRIEEKAIKSALPSDGPNGFRSNMVYPMEQLRLHLAILERHPERTVGGASMSSD